MPQLSWKSICLIALFVSVKPIASQHRMFLMLLAQAIWMCRPEKTS